MASLHKQHLFFFFYPDYKAILHSNSGGRERSRSGEGCAQKMKTVPPKPSEKAKHLFDVGDFCVLTIHKATVCSPLLQGERESQRIKICLCWVESGCSPEWSSSSFPCTCSLMVPHSRNTYISQSFLKSRAVIHAQILSSLCQRDAKRGVNNIFLVTKLGRLSLFKQTCVETSLLALRLKTCVITSSLLRITCEQIFGSKSFDIITYV